MGKRAPKTPASMRERLHAAIHRLLIAATGPCADNSMTVNGLADQLTDAVLNHITAAREEGHV